MFRQFWRWLTRRLTPSWATVRRSPVAPMPRAAPPAPHPLTAAVVALLTGAGLPQTGWQSYLHARRPPAREGVLIGRPVVYKSARGTWSETERAEGKGPATKLRHGRGSVRRIVRAGAKNLLAQAAAARDGGGV